MDKKTKIILGGLFIAAGVGLYLWDKNNDKDDAAVAAPIAIATSTCNEGEVPCSNNPKICYSPNARYAINPCTVTTSGNIDIPSGNSEEQEAFIPTTR